MVTTSTFIQDTVLFIRNELDSNVTDPIASDRTARERFVMTSYPERGVKYPIITVRNIGAVSEQRLGMQSELIWVRMPLELRIWARNEKERDEITQDTYNHLRSNQFGGGSSSVDDEDLHDFTILSAVPVDEDGETGVKSMVMTAQYMFVLGQ